MAEDYCSSWSAWKIWLHPKKALGTLIDSGFMQENLESQLQQALDALEDCRLEIQKLSAQNATLAQKAGEDAERLARLEDDMGKFTCELAETRSRLDTANEELAETRRHLEAANAELAERKDVETQLKEFDDKLSGVEKLKADYENKIAILRKQLNDANTRLQRQRESGNSDIIESGTPSSPRKSCGSESNAGLQTRNGEYRPSKITMKEPDDDWLLDTPDNLI